MIHSAKFTGHSRATKKKKKKKNKKKTQKKNKNKIKKARKKTLELELALCKRASVSAIVGGCAVCDTTPKDFGTPSVRGKLLKLCVPMKTPSPDLPRSSGTETSKRVCLLRSRRAGCLHSELSPSLTYLSASIPRPRLLLLLQLRVCFSRLECFSDVSHEL